MHHPSEVSGTGSCLGIFVPLNAANSEKFGKTKTAHGSALSSSLQQSHVLHCCSAEMAGSQAARLAWSVTLEKSFSTTTTQPLLVGRLVGRTRAPELRSASVLTASKEFTEGLVPKESGGTHPMTCWGSGTGGEQGGAAQRLHDRAGWQAQRSSTVENSLLYARIVYI